MSDSLKTYRDKRDFRKTAEPAGGQKEPSDRPIFVIQEHDSSTLHYDFRLEIEGALKSWAIPKGPSTDPGEKRLAMPTEDHPLDYADFEGMIPEGEYGAGPVLVWDAGAYRNLRAEKEDQSERRSMTESFEEGQIEVWLAGKKLQGGYALVRTNQGDDERWLFIKMRDDEADARRNPTSTEPHSVLSGRTIDEVREEEREVDSRG